jgi:syntaxin 18
MVEISELQSTLAQNLALQSERIDVLVEDAANTEQNVVGGNKQLKRATERWRPAKFVFHATLGLCGFLVVWDLIF